MINVNELLEMRDEIERLTKGKVVGCKGETKDTIIFELRVDKKALLKKHPKNTQVTQVIPNGKKLMSNHRRSLVTIITYHHPLTEQQIVIITSSIIALSTLLGYLIQTLMKI